MQIKVMIVDDEPRIRLILRKVIEQTEDFEVIWECGSMKEALLRFSESRPDVVFMDVDLKGSADSAAGRESSEGIDCARIMMNAAPDLKLIFATAYAEYMPSAFEMYAFDYLVKPFDVGRIRRTLERIHKQYEEKKETDEQPKSSAAAKTADERLMIKGREAISIVKPADIYMVMREGDLTVIRTAKERIETNMTMQEMEKRLPAPKFLRAHRSYIINVDRISSIEPYGRWTFIVKFAGIKEDALITKEKFDEISSRFS
ncbi:MAG: response regulator transcription factor [Firmicutes bacterium]|nr:response regulator transcription factor [Bacillota bacterium]